MINNNDQIQENKFLLKSDIKKVGSNCARILLVLAITTYVIGFGFAYFFKISGIFLNINIGSNIENNIILGMSKDAYNFFTGYLPCIIGDIIAIFIALKTLKVKVTKDIFTKINVEKKFVILGTVSCIGVGMVSSIIYIIYAVIFKIFGMEIPQPDFNFPQKPIFLILFLIYVCLIGPILEEIIFRGFILKSLQKYGNLTAIIVTSILFSMFHLNLVQFINPILMGIILAFITIKSKSIFPSMIAHIFNNTITFIVSALEFVKNPLIQDTFAIVYFIIGIVVLLLFISNYKQDFFEIIKEENNILSTFQKVKNFFMGAWAKAYIIFYILFIVGTTIVTNL